MICYLYEIRFPSDKSYIGISCNPRARLARHISDANGGRKTPLASAIRKYGGHALRLLVLAVGSLEYTQDLEIKAIAALRTTDPAHGYNISPGGEISPMKVEATRAKVSATMRRRFMDPSYGRHFLGKSHTEEARRKISEAGKGRIISDWHKTRISLGNKGKKVSDETRRKMKEARGNWKHIPETKAKMSEAQKKRVRTSKELERLRQYSQNKGPLSPEYRQKLSEAALRRWAAVRAARTA